MKKIVDVFVMDRLVASYPIVAEELAGPTPNDEHFVELVKAQQSTSSRNRRPCREHHLRH